MPAGGHTGPESASVGDRHRHLLHLDRLRGAERSRAAKRVMSVLAILVLVVVLLAWAYPLPCVGGCGY